MTGGPESSEGTIESGEESQDVRRSAEDDTSTHVASESLAIDTASQAVEDPSRIPHTDGEDADVSHMDDGFIDRGGEPGDEPQDEPSEDEPRQDVSNESLSPLHAPVKTAGTLRFVTFNVCGIKNVLNYPPWNEQRSFAAMFQSLDADVVCFQETKIQARDVTAAMALVPGYDAYMSFPVVKKGYSGVAIYVKHGIRVHKAEDGITGWQGGRGGSTCYRDMGPEDAIGGYPANIDSKLGQQLDSEGRCVVLDLGSCVVVGLYCPADSQGDRPEFRENFLAALDLRLRKLVEEEHRQVVVLGDLNISREIVDSAPGRQEWMKQGILRIEPGHGTGTESSDPAVESAEDTDGVPIVKRPLPPPAKSDGSVLEDAEQFLIAYSDIARQWRVATTARQLLHGWLTPSFVFHDTTREAHPTRMNMYTCWNQKINARPGNFGSRIDYILVTDGMECRQADILPRLLGSDHCPVFADVTVSCGAASGDAESSGQLQPTAPSMCAANLAQFRGEQKNIKALFQSYARRRPASPIGRVEQSSDAQRTSNVPSAPLPQMRGEPHMQDRRAAMHAQPQSSAASGVAPKKQNGRVQTPLANANVKRPKLANATSSKQHSVLTFFAPAETRERADWSEQPTVPASEVHWRGSSPNLEADRRKKSENWSNIFAPVKPPLCSGHHEPCILLTSKKSGINKGRAFWVCPRPTGEISDPNNSFRCDYFKWK